MRHLKDHGLNYFQHMYVAFYYAANLAIMLIAAIIHGIIPFVLKTYVTDTMKKLINQK
tara:strand:- start:626 stop:799 length:174 start_codon:yes stop_codon:yes gene_type:complete